MDKNCYIQIASPIDVGFRDAYIGPCKMSPDEFKNKVENAVHRILELIHEDDKEAVFMFVD